MGPLGRSYSAAPALTAAVSLAPYYVAGYVAAAAWVGSLLQDMVPVGQLRSTAREVAKSGAQGQRLSDIFAAPFWCLLVSLGR